MQSLVGIVRNRPEEALEKLDDPKERTAKVSVGGSGLQPRLEPGDRSAGDAHRVNRHGSRGAPPQGKPRRPRAFGKEFVGIIPDPRLPRLERSVVSHIPCTGRSVVVGT